MNATTRDDPDTATRARGRCAVWIHALLLPYWLLAWYVAAALTASSGGADAQGLVLALWIGFGVAFFGLGVGLWLTLLRRLVRQMRHGPGPSCLLPVFWAVCTMFTVFFAAAYFAWTLLVPALGRKLASPKS